MSSIEQVLAASSWIWLWWLLPAAAGVALGYTVWWYFRQRPPPPSPPPDGSG